MSGKADSGTAYQHPLLPAELQAEYRRRGDWQGITLAQIAEQRAAEHPDRPAVVGPHPLTYGDLWEQARRVAGALEDGGLRPGDFLVSVMSNCVEGLVLEIAASITALTYAPRSAHMSPAEAINLFAQLDARGLVLQRSMLERDGWSEAFEHLRKRLQDRPVWIHGETVDGLPTLAQAIESGRAIDPVEQDPGQPCLVLATGGTTGMPKSVLHSSETLVYAARSFGRAINYSADDVHVAIAPYGHAGGSVFEVYMPLLHGAAVLPIARWKPRDVAETIGRYGGTFFIAMGTHVYDLLALDPSAAPQLRSIRCIATGAGPQEIFVKCDEELMPVVRVYGLSEAVGHALGRLDDPASVRVLQDGVPFDGMDWRIVDPRTGDPVPPGAIGEYQCRGPNMFMGYYGQDDITAKALTDDGYYRTGDLMVLSDEGYVSWTGRTKDIIRRGGLQIDPIEIEGMLSRHPQINTVAVVGQPDMRLGERAVIVAVPASDERAELGELCAYLQREGLPKQSLPERLVYVDDLPRTGVGKVHRVRVKDMILEGDGHVNPATEPMLREWYFEDFEVGQVHTTMGRTLAEADVMTFVGFTGIFEQIFINAEYAREQTIFGRRVVPGLCVLVVVEGLYVLTGHTHHGKAFLGLDELEINTPVACGDTIHAEVTVESVRPSSKHEGHGVMALRHHVLNQDGVEVMSYKTVRLMECRPA